MTEQHHEINDGKWLEELVGVIEGRLSPVGFKTETRKPVFNEQGVQVAEFDIVISGRLGTSELSWLIECRDRPSDGTAPAEWIEQLMGRRARFRFDKVMAVSSTGFSPGAIEAAKDAKIDLRHMASLTYEEVEGWLPTHAPVIIHRGRFSAARVFVLAPSHLEQDTQQAFMKSAKVFVGKVSGETASIEDLWSKVVNNSALWKGISEGDPPKTTTVRAQEYLFEEYSVSIDKELLPIESIEFDATFQAIIPRMPLVEAASYDSGSEDSNKKQTFARLGHWKSVEDGPIKELIFIGFLRRERPDDAT